MTLMDQIGAKRRILNVSGSCGTCPRKRVDFVPPTLRQGSILWLGEAPGATEVEEQEGFAGRSGQLLRRIAAEYQVPEPWSFSNTIHCRPPDNATPKPKEISCCLSQFVLDEIRGYPIVVLAGSVPLKALFPGAKGSHFRGNVAHHPDFPGQRFYAIYHPSYILRNPWMEQEFRQQIERLGRIARGEAERTWQLVRGAGAFDALVAMLQEPLLSLDLETNGKETWQLGARIRSFCATGDGKTVVAMDESEPAFLSALVKLQEFLEKPEKSVVGANIAYDIQYLESDLEFHSKCTGIHDVAIWWYEAGQYKQASLKKLVAQQLDGYRYLVHEPDKEQDIELLLNYNAEDVVHAYHLFLKAVGKVEPQTQDLVSRVLSPAVLIYRQAQAHGLYLRQDYRKQKIEEYQEKRRTEVLAWKQEDPEFIPDEFESGNGLAKYLFQIRKLPVISLTENDQPSVDKAAIKQWVRDGAIYLKHLLKIREYDKLLSTYLTAYDDHVGPDSRIHPRFWMNSTDTSRPSSSNPNVFNIPRNSEIRDLFGVPHGYAMGESDLSQIEFRIMVCLAKDENGIAGYLRGDDAHTMTARTIAGVETPTKAQRSEAKPVNFALLYGGEWPVVQRAARDEFDKDWDEALCRKFTRDFMATYPRIPEFHELSATKLIHNRGWFRSVTGHVFHYEDWESRDTGRRDHAFRAALNSEAQGPANNICLYIARLARQLLNERGFERVRFVNSVYDSIMTESPNPKWMPDVFATIDEAAQMAHQWVKSWFIVPLIIEHAVGESWGSLKEYKAA
jgi:uracil-DNA glycosylase family 4